MRFLFFSTETRPIVGGIARALDGWLTGLVLAGHNVCMVSMLPERLCFQIKGLAERPYREEWLWLPDRAENAWDQFIITRKFRSALFLLRQKQLIEQRTAQVLTKFKPDLVVFAVLNPVACMPLGQVLLAGLKSAAIAYGSEIQPKRVPNLKWLRATLARMDRLIAISEYTRQQLSQWVEPAAQIEIVHPALSSNLEVKIDRELNVPGRKLTLNPVSGEVRLLTICRLVERKGVQTVLSAIHLLRIEIPNLRYDVVGDGPFRFELESLASRLDIADQVRFHGGLLDDERNRLLCNCDLFVMTPFEASDGDVEGFGIVFLEAGLYGKPVIASDSGGVADAVRHQETGWLIAPGDVNELAAAIRRLVKDVLLYEQLAKAGFTWARQHMPIHIGQSLSNVLTVES